MTQRRRALLFLLVVVGLVIASAVVVFSRPTVLGLDLQGGVEVILEGRATADSQVTDESIERSVDIIRNRVDSLGVREPEIQKVGDNQIQVSLPGAEDPEAVEDLIKPAQLVFTDYQGNLVRTDPSLYEMVRLAQKTTPTPPVQGSPSYYLFKKDAKHTLLAGPDVDRETLLRKFDGKVPDGAEVLTVPKGLVIYSQEEVLDPSRENSPVRRVYALMQDKPALTGRDITEAAQSFQQAGIGGGSTDPIVTMQFTGEGQREFQNVTRQLAQRGSVRGELQSFAIVLDGEIISTPTIDYREFPTGIDGSNGAQIQGGFTVDEARTLADQLNSGAIPIALEVISQKQVSATLGDESLQQALIAGLAGLFLVIVFLILYYRLLGVIAAVALGIYALFLFAVVELIPITLTLPGIAGMILTIGVASDANVVIFERMREEARAGRSAKNALLAGYRKGISAIIDANVVTFLTAFILFMLGTAGVKGFAFTLMVGVALSLFTAVLVTRAVIEVGADSKWFQNEKLMGLNQREPRWKFDFVGRWRLWLAISFIPLAAGAAVIGVRGLNLGLDFESGTRVVTSFEQGQPGEQEVRDVLTQLGYGDAKIQETTDPGTGEVGFQIQTETLQPAELNELKRTLDRELGGVNEESYQVDTVGPTFGRQIVYRAFWAVALSFLLIIVYLTIRFEIKLALPALLSVVHDVWLALSIYAIIGAEVTSATVAALLTIMGYSLYDVVIVFDRIRENQPLMGRNSRYADIVNRSVHEVLTRSIITGAITIIPVTALLLFGGPTLRDFALALFIGLLTGGVSSIAIAAPLAALWKEREPASRRGQTRAAKRAAKVAAADADVVDLDVLARAEAALDGQMARAEAEHGGDRVAAEIEAEAGRVPQEGMTLEGGVVPQAPAPAPAVAEDPGIAPDTDIDTDPVPPVVGGTDDAGPEPGTPTEDPPTRPERVRRHQQIPRKRRK